MALALALALGVVGCGGGGVTLEEYCLSTYCPACPPDLESCRDRCGYGRPSPDGNGPNPCEPQLLEIRRCERANGLCYTRRLEGELVCNDEALAFIDCAGLRDGF